MVGYEAGNAERPANPGGRADGTRKQRGFRALTAINVGRQRNQQWVAGGS